MKKLRDLDSRENWNILEFEIDKILSDKQLSVLKVLNSFSFRLFSFIVPVGKRFTDLFFRFLDFFSRNTEML